MTNWVNQSGVIPVLDGRLCMVTSRSRKRWVFPKGVIEPGHTPREAGLIEAWEEAGLVGTLEPEPVGKDVVRVIEAHDAWPERGLRDRTWVSVAEAIERTEERGLQELLRRAFDAGHPDHVSRASA